jgi:hypothetical protein
MPTPEELAKMKPAGRKGWALRVEASKKLASRSPFGREDRLEAAAEASEQVSDALQSDYRSVSLKVAASSSCRCLDFLSLSLSLSLFLRLCVCVRLPVCLSTCLPVYLSTCQPVCVCGLVFSFFFYSLFGFVKQGTCTDPRGVCVYLSPLFSFLFCFLSSLSYVAVWLAVSPV